MPAPQRSRAAHEAITACVDYRTRHAGTNPTPDEMRRAALETLGAVQDVLSVVTVALVSASECTCDAAGAAEATEYARAGAETLGVARVLLAEVYEAVEWTAAPVAGRDA